MEQQNIKTPIIFRVSMILLCVVLLSAHMVGNGLYARYSSNATGSGEARVANFSVNIINDTGSFPTKQTLDLSEAADEADVTWSFTIKNDSEVVSEEKVLVTLEQELPIGITVSMTVNDKVCEPDISENTYTYTVDFPIGEEHVWVLTFIGDPEVAVAAEIKGDIDVVVTQID